MLPEIDHSTRVGTWECGTANGFAERVETPGRHSSTSRLGSRCCDGGNGVNVALGYSSLFRAHILGHGLGAWLAMVRNLMDDEVATEALAAHLGVALDNELRLTRMTELQEIQREIVHQLEEAVRPPMPAVEAAELGIHYLPADPSAPTGGDLHDWLVLPDGDLFLAVVDVMGKGVAATKEALAVTELGEVAPATDDVSAQVHLKAARAKILARVGRMPAVRL